MRKLKKQDDEAKKRKEMAKKEKSWVGGSTTPRDVVSPRVADSKSTAKGFDFNALD